MEKFHHISFPETSAFGKQEPLLPANYDILRSEGLFEPYQLPPLPGTLSAKSFAHPKLLTN